VRRKKTGGRVRDSIIYAYAVHYGLTKKQTERLRSMVVQIALCKSDEARRLLLGVSRREA